MASSSGEREVVLKSYFGFSSLRPYQREVVDNVLTGRDCLLVMATGAGKSMCYQLPPLLTKKTAIVISPLLSLMQDQVMSLNQKGVRADYLGSTQKNTSVIHCAENGLYDVLYLTPEKAMSLPKSFWENLRGAGVCLFTVDEAHCISEWGHDFRKEYKRLQRLRANLPGIPYMALTATATERVRTDIKRSLNLHEPFVYIGSFDRPNLFYGVRMIKSSAQSEESLEELLKEVPRRVTANESTIIYCTTVRDTEKVHSSLASSGIDAVIYHGQLSSEARMQAHRSFVTDEVLVMVATIAFGMGIDKPDVRCVIHYGCPKSLESYYQESGRCGRDGLPSVCWLYYSRSDYTRKEFYCSGVESQSQKKSIIEAFIAGWNYCGITTCRRQRLLSYFGEVSAATCGNCDNCNRTVHKERDLSEEAALLLGCINECGGRWGLNLPIDILIGSKKKKVRDNNFHTSTYHGKGVKYETTWWKGLGSILLSNGLLLQTIDACYTFVSVSEQGRAFLCSYNNNRQSLFLRMTPEMVDEDEETSSTDEESLEEQNYLSNDEARVYLMLIDTRKSIAKDTGVAPYAICSDKVLKDIAKTRPSNEENLSMVEGVNLNFIARYGHIVVHCVKEMCHTLGLELDNLELEDEEVGEDDDSSMEDAQGNEEQDVPSDITAAPVMYPSEYDVPARSTAQNVLDILSYQHGLTMDDILKSLEYENRRGVERALRDLEYSLIIYQRNGKYFKV